MIINSESLTWLKTQEDNTIDSVVTDPPYLIDFMGKKWDSADAAPGKSEFWVEVLRVLKPGGHIAVFSHSRTYHRVATAIEDAGFEIRDQLQWLYGSGFPKSFNLGKAYDAKIKTGKSSPKAMREAGMGNDYKQTPGAGTPDYGNVGNHFGNGSDNYEHDYDNEWKGWGTALKPAQEPIVLARKPLDNKISPKTGKPTKSRLTVVDNVIKWGTGGLNIDGCRVPNKGETFDNLKEDDGTNINFTKLTNNNVGGNAEALEKLRSEGRFPANVIHDGSDEVLELFPTTTSGYTAPHHKTKEDSSWYGAAGEYSSDSKRFGGTGSAARYFYCAKVNKKERNIGMDYTIEIGNTNPKLNGGTNTDPAFKEALKNKDDSKGTTNHHPTVKPVALMAYLCKLITPKGGTVLDLFNGSGSTGMACKQEGFDYIGVEMDPEYCKISEARIAAWSEDHKWRGYKKTNQTNLLDQIQDHDTRREV